MALFFAGTGCPICNEPMHEHHELLSFTFLGIEDERFMDLDDGVVHCDCLFNWEHRDDFIQCWNEYAKKSFIKQQELEIKNDKCVYKVEKVEWVLDWIFEIFDFLMFPITFPLEQFHILKCKITNTHPKTGRKLGGPCPYCKNKLPTPQARQCLACGMDWHAPLNPRNLTKK